MLSSNQLTKVSNNETLENVGQSVCLPGFAFSGPLQAQEGRLVDALAIRGDEGRDTLR